MTEVLALLLVLVAVTLLYAADSHHRGVILPFLAVGHRARTARWSAVLAVGASVFFLRTVEPGPAAFLVALVALMAMETGVVLLGAIAPRAVRATLVLALGAIPPLAALGGVP